MPYAPGLMPLNLVLEHLGHGQCISMVGRLEQRPKSGSRWGSGLSLFSGMGVVSREREELCVPKLKAPRQPPSWFSQRAKWIFAEPGQSSLGVRTSSLYWYQPGRISRVEGDWSKFNQMHVAMIERGWEVLVGHAVDGVSHTLRWHGKAAWVCLRIPSIPPRPGAREAFFSSVRGAVLFFF